MDDGARLAATLYRPAGDPATVRFTADAERFGLTVRVGYPSMSVGGSILF